MIEVLGDEEAQNQPEEDSAEEYYSMSMREHIAKTLSAQGEGAFTEVTGIKPQNPDLWEVTGDDSVQVADADKDGYRWLSVEVVSPKLEFTPANLARVKKVCDTLAKTYKYRVNYTTGIHVHVGDDDRGFPLQVMKRLMYVPFPVSILYCRTRSS